MNELPSSRTTLAFAATALLAGCATSTAVPATPAPVCNAQIIVTFASGAGEPDAAFVSALADAVRVRLTLLRPLSERSQLFALSSEEVDSDCVSALARLRADPRVRSADVNTRRKPQG